MTDAGRDARVAAAFEQALDLPDAERPGFVAALGALRGDVEELLRAHASLEDTFLAVPGARRLHDGAASLPAPGDVLGRYRIERVLGAGASGVVFEARQAEPDRLVALKVLRAAIAGDAESARFRAEAAVLARLSHPGIAHVYEAGVDDGRPWIAMELVPDGRPVTEDAVARGRSVAERVRLLEGAATALAHAHDRGVVHRDVKPANLLTDREGRVRVVDFGIAVGADAVAETAGTPGYMAPEQARGDAADARSDVWGLGAVLCELLTGVPPVAVAGCTPAEALARSAAPGAADRPWIADGDLAAVVGKALAPERGARYGSAGEFAADLRRWLDGFPVVARPPSAGHAFRLFLRRRPGLAVAIGSAVLALVAGTAVSVSFAVTAGRERERAEAARARAERQAYTAEIVAAAAAIELRDLTTARRALARAPESLRGFEWRLLAARTGEDVLGFVDPAFRPYGSVVTDDGAVVHVLGSTKQGTEVRRIRTDGGGTETTALPGFTPVTAFGPCGAGRVAVGRRDGTVVIVERDGTLRAATPAHEGPVNVVAADPLDTAFATGGWDGKVHVFEARGGTVLRTIDAHGDRVVGLRFAPDGRVLASAGRDGLVRLWRTTDGGLVRTLGPLGKGVEDLAFSPDGGTLVTVSRDALLRLWDVRDGTLRTVLPGHTENVRAVAWSADGTRIATASYDRTTALWDAGSGTLLRRFTGHETVVRSVAFLPPDADGARFLTTGHDGVRIWSERRGGALSSFLPVRDVTFTCLEVEPGGARALVAELNGTVRLVDLRSGAVLWSDAADPAPALSQSVDPMHVRAATFAFPGEVRCVDVLGGERRLDLRSGRRIAVRAGAAAVVEGVWVPGAAADRPDRFIVADGVGLRWTDPETGAVRLAHRWRDDEGPASGVAIAVDPRDGRVVASHVSGVVLTGRPLDGEPMHAPAVRTEPYDCCAMAPAGRGPSRFVCGREDGSIEVLDAATGAGIARSVPHGGLVRSVRWSPCGSRIVTGGDDRTVRVLDGETAAELLVLRTPWSVGHACFTDDGNAIVVLAHGAVDERALLVWRAAE